MKRFAFTFLVLMSAHYLIHGQTLATSSFPIHGWTDVHFIDWGSYTMEKLDTSVYAVTYNSSIMVDTLLRDNFYSTHVLLVGHNVNKYLQKDKLTYDLSRTKGSANLRVCENQHPALFYETVYQHLDSGLTTTTERLCQDDFMVTEDTPIQEWSLIDEKKIIGDYMCSLAECHFRGRHYYAWYTEDIPMPYGPWKLGGLPGLIVSAYDIDHQYEFTMTEFGTESIPIFRINYDYIETDRKHLNKLINEILHKPAVYKANHLHKGGWRINAGVLAKERDIVYQYDAIEKD